MTTIHRKDKKRGTVRFGPDDSSRWAAVRRKDARADGLFYYAVRTTGIYCRPSCASRMPLRDNVLFFGDPKEAEAHGYRPCKRCRPEGLNLQQEQQLKVVEACRRIESAEEELSLAQLAKNAGLSLHHFHRLFKERMGMTPKEYALARRFGRAREELARPGAVTGAIYEAGFNSSGRFYEQAGRMLGMKAKIYRDGGPGEKIWYAVAKSELGQVLVAATARGICAVSLGNDRKQLILELRSRFKRAQLVRGGLDFAEMVTGVLRQIGKRTGRDFPLDLRGTLFQKKVWRALQKIPVGSTRSYAELARELGRPSAARAVAGACAANTIAVLVPCHRVLRGGGEISGYRWGVVRKKKLLEMERKVAESDRGRTATD